MRARWGLARAPDDRYIQVVKELGAVGTMAGPRFRRRFGFAVANWFLVAVGAVSYRRPSFRALCRVLGDKAVVWVTGRFELPAMSPVGYAAIGFALVNPAS